MITRNEKKYILELKSQHDRDCLTSIVLYVRHRDEFSKYRLQCYLYEIFARNDRLFYTTIINKLNSMPRNAHIDFIRNSVASTIKDIKITNGNNWDA